MPTDLISRSALLRSLRGKLGAERRHMKQMTGVEYQRALDLSVQRESILVEAIRLVESAEGVEAARIVRDGY